MFFGKNGILMQLTPIRNDDIIGIVIEKRHFCYKFIRKVSLNCILSDTFTI